MTGFDFPALFFCSMRRRSKAKERSSAPSSNPLASASLPSLRPEPKRIFRRHAAASFDSSPPPHRASREGDFNPPADPVTVLTRQQTRQVRRLETFVRNLRTHQQRGWPEHGRHSLVQQWTAVLRAGGYAPSFPDWVLRVAHFDQFFLADPPLEWVQDLYLYVRFDCNAQVRAQVLHRSGVFFLRTRLDELEGSSVGFQQLRRQPYPPIQSLPCTEERALVVAFATSPCCAAYHCSSPQSLQCAEAHLEDGTPAVVRSYVPDPAVEGTLLLEVQFPGDPPAQCKIRQNTAAVTPEHLSQLFTSFWFPIWNRDSKQDSTDVFRWGAFLDGLPEPPSSDAISLDLADVTLWKQALSRLQSGRATGICGCAVAELKQLPPEVLVDLVGLFQRVLTEGAFPSYMCKSTVCCVPKVLEPQDMSQCRPITIFATLYRFFASAVSRQVLQHWGSSFPSSIYGALPGRSARDAALSLELEVEKSLTSNLSVLGFSVDLSRFFNLLPRPPTQFLLGLLGVPTSVVTVWSNFLRCADRYPCTGGSLGASVPASTGVPEGDPCSILAQAAINWALVQKLQYSNLRTLTYIDNWAWVAGTRLAFATALQVAQDFCAQLKLQISWVKSFAWAIRKEDRSWIQTRACELLPLGAQLALVDATRDLGVAYRFRKFLGSRPVEGEGRARMAKLEVLPRSLPNKIQLLRQAVWPASIYGLESYLLPEQTIVQLRSRAAQALLGRKTAKSPVLTLALLSAILDPEPLLLLQGLRGLCRMLRVDPAQGREWLHGTVLARRKLGLMDQLPRWLPCCGSLGVPCLRV